MLDLPFLLIFVAIMFWYSVTLTLIVLAHPGADRGLEPAGRAAVPARLNEQFLRGAANQAFVTEYVAGLETVKSLQLEPQLNQRYRDLLADVPQGQLRRRGSSPTPTTPGPAASSS